MATQVPLQIHGEMRVYTVPDGLGELMNDISKEVLRVQPKNIYYFIAEYLLTLLKVREAVKIAVPVVDQAIEEAKGIKEFYRRLGASPQEANRAATVIQAAYRGYQVRKKIRNIISKLKERQLKKIEEEAEGSSKSDSQHSYSRDSFFRTLNARGITKNMSVAAATKIQAFFRGYYARMKLNKEGTECFLSEIPSHESWRHDWMDDFKKEEELSRKSGSTILDFKEAVEKSVEGDRLKLTSLFHGSYEDYATELSCEDLLKLSEEDLKSDMKEDIFSSDHFFPDLVAESVESMKSGQIVATDIVKELLEKTFIQEGIDESLSINSEVSQKIPNRDNESKGSLLSVYSGTTGHNMSLGSLGSLTSLQSPKSVKSSKYSGGSRKSMQELEKSLLEESQKDVSTKSHPEFSTRSQEGSLKSVREGSVKSFQEGSVKPISERSAKSFREGSVKSFREGSIKSARDGLTKSAHEGSQKLTQEGSAKSLREVSYKSVREGSVRSLPEVTVKSINGGSNKSLIPEDAVKSLHSIGSKKSGGSQKSNERKSSIRKSSKS